MPSLVSATETYIRTGALNDLFDTVKRQIVIFKEPTQTINQTSANPLVGYEETSIQNSDVSYTPVSGIYSGQVIYARLTRQDNPRTIDNKIILNPNSTYIKVKRDARNYIKNGTKTEAISFDDTLWNIEGSEQVQDYLGLQFYYFELKATN
jgi:hypothetical protein